MIDFQKYQGLGNDFVIFEGRNLNSDESRILEELEMGYSQFLCNRHFGVGADGVIVALEGSGKAEIKMKIYNSDGSEAEMCGNGIRCLSKYLLRKGEFLTQTEYKIETLAGIISITCEENEDIRVDMGTPILEPENIPTYMKENKYGLPQAIIRVNESKYTAYAVGMGNPHMIIILDDIDNIPFRELGTKLEKNELFPANTNVHFVKLIDNNNIGVRVWERGAGETMACGTGACACLVTTSILKLTSNSSLVHLPGGQLRIEWPHITGSIYMTGPADYIYSGKIPISN